MACVSSSMAMAERISSYCALLVALMLVLSCCELDEPSLAELGAVIRETHQVMNRPCDEIYLVREGETLQTIGDKCRDPYIVERNPHIHDPDDVFPGLVIKINPSDKRLFRPKPGDLPDLENLNDINPEKLGRKKSEFSW